MKTQEKKKWQEKPSLNILETFFSLSFKTGQSWKLIDNLFLLYSFISVSVNKCYLYFYIFFYLYIFFI